MKIKMLIEREIQDQGFPGSVRRLDGAAVYDLPDVLAKGLINAGSAKEFCESTQYEITGVEESGDGKTWQKVADKSDSDAPPTAAEHLLAMAVAEEVALAERDGIALNVKQLGKDLAAAPKAAKSAIAEALKAEKALLKKAEAALEKAVAARIAAEAEAEAEVKVEAAEKGGE